MSSKIAQQSYGYVEGRSKENSLLTRFAGNVFFILLILVVLILSARSSFCATYYVSPSGNDSDAGTLAKPWKTLLKAATTPVAGDTVYIREGIYQERFVPQKSGSEGMYITFTAYPGETVTVDGTGMTLSPYSGLVAIEDKKYIRVSGLRVTNSGPGGDNPGISVDASSHIIIEKNYTYKTASSGIIVWGSSNIIIDGNEVERACEVGALSNNECITVGETATFEIRNNHVHHGNTVRGEGIVAKDGSSNGMVYGNHVHHVPHIGIYIDAQARYTHDIDVYQNIVHDVFGDPTTGGSGIAIVSEEGGLLENVMVFNNISYHNYATGIELHDCCVSKRPIKNIQIVNNTIYDNGWGGWGGGILHVNPDAQDVVIRNNIVSSNLSFQIGLEGVAPGSVTIDHNLIDGFRGEDGEILGENYVEGDPRFVGAATGDFHLNGNSPAIDQGSQYNAPSIDFEGDKRPLDGNCDGTATVDIGADERALSTCGDGNQKALTWLLMLLKK